MTQNEFDRPKQLYIVAHKRLLLGVCLSVFVLLCKLSHIKYHNENSIQQSTFSFISIYFMDLCNKGAQQTEYT